MLAQVLGCDAGEAAACLRVGGRLESLGLIDTPIAEHAITDLGDLMRSVPGFYASSDGGYGYVGVRGVNRTRDYGGRLLLLVDGQRMNDPSYGTFANRQDFALDLDLIERVEVVRGPGSSLYGDNAFFGVVNVITRRGRDIGGGEASASYGSYDTGTGRVTYGGQASNGVEVVLSGSLYDSHGEDDLYFAEFDDPATLNGRAEDLDDESAGSLYGRVNYRGFGLGGGHVAREKQLPSGRYDTVFGDPRFVVDDERTYAFAEYDGTLWAQWELLARLTYDRYVYDGNYPYRYSAGGPVVIYREQVDAQWVGGEVQARTQVGDRQWLTLGADYRNTFSVDSLSYDVDPYALIDDADPDFQNWGLFVQDEIRLAPWALVNAGIRLDSYDTFGEAISPRLGLILNPAADTTFKLLYGEAFRAPNVNELYYQNDGVVLDVNPDLEAETITTYEAIWEQRYGRRVRTSVAAFRNEITDIVEFSPDVDLVESFYYVNAGDATVDGCELQLEVGLRDGVRGRASYTFAQVDRPAGETDFDNSPAHLAQFNLLAPLGTERCTLGLEAQYLGARLVDGGDEVPAYWVANATLFSQPFGDDVDLSFSLYNLFDEDYDDPAYGTPTQVPQNGRSFRVKATVRF